MQDIFIRLMKLVGLKPDEKGICHGSAVLALQAFILGTEYYQKYIRRLEKIVRLSSEIDDEFLKHDLESCDNQGVLKYSDILAHLQALKLFHSPDEHLEVFNGTTTIRQSDVSTVASIAQSYLAEKRGGIRLVSSFSGVYSYDDMQIYLTSLKKVMEIPTHKATRFGILMSANRHVIMLSYDAANVMCAWTIDNVAEVTRFSSEQCIEVGKKIRGIFNYDTLNDKPLILSTAVYSTADQIEKAKLIIDNWQVHCGGIHQVIAEKANLVGLHGMTWLFRAAESGHTQTVELLLKTGAYANVKTNDGRTPLYVAAGNGHTKIVQLLLEKELDVNAKTSAGLTSLHIAAEGGFTTIVKLLLKAGADAHATSNDNLTPLDYALDGGYTEIAELLRKPKVENRAVENINISVIKSISTADDINRKNNFSFVSPKIGYENKENIKLVSFKKNNKDDKFISSQRPFNWLAFIFFTTLSLVVSAHLISSPFIILGIVLTTATLMALTLKWTPIVTKVKALIFSTEQKNIQEGLIKASVNLPKTTRFVPAPLLHDSFSSELKDMNQSEMYTTQVFKPYLANEEPQKKLNLELNSVLTP